MDEIGRLGVILFHERVDAARARQAWRDQGRRILPWRVGQARRWCRDATARALVALAARLAPEHPATT
jgi:hypothetical protein